MRIVLMNLFNKLSKRKIAIWCKNENQAKNFLDICRIINSSWNTGEKIKDDTKWSIYKENTCYAVCNINIFENNKLMKLLEQGFQIISYESFFRLYENGCSYKDNFDYYYYDIKEILKRYKTINPACDDIIETFNITHNGNNKLDSIFKWGTSPHMPRPDALEKLNFEKEIKIDKNKEIIVYQNTHTGIKIELFPELKKYNVIFKKQNEFLDATTTNAIYSILKNM